MHFGPTYEPQISNTDLLSWSKSNTKSQKKKSNTNHHYNLNLCSLHRHTMKQTIKNTLPWLFIFQPQTKTLLSRLGFDQTLRHYNEYLFQTCQWISQVLWFQNRPKHKPLKNFIKIILILETIYEFIKKISKKYPVSRKLYRFCMP